MGSNKSNVNQHVVSFVNKQTGACNIEDNTYFYELLTDMWSPDEIENHMIGMGNIRAFL